MSNLPTDAIPKIHIRNPNLTMLANIQRGLFDWLIVFGCTTIPWLVGWYIHWWIGFVTIGLLFCVYDRLFVAKGSLCMGIPFMVPLMGALVYFGWGILQFLVWWRHQFV
jgi:hypothetical protein